MKLKVFKFISFLFIANLFILNSIFAFETVVLKTKIENAPMLDVEKLLVPVSTVSKGPQMLVPNPGGQTFDLLQWYYKSYSGPTTVFIIDLGSGEIKQDGIPLGRQIHMSGRVVGPDGKLYISTPLSGKGMELYIYDPAINSLANKGVVVTGLEGERRHLVIGTDGMIYGSGSYPGLSKAGAFRLDPWTFDIVDYGPLGPSHAPNSCLGDTIAADRKYVYIASGMIPWYLVAYDKLSGQDKVLLITENVGGSISVTQERDGCSVKAKGLADTMDNEVEYWLYQGELFEKKPGQRPPWIKTKTKNPWVDMELASRIFPTSGEPREDGTAEIKYQKKTRVKDDNDRWETIKLKLPTYPVKISRILEMPDGRFFGAAERYQGYFIYDPKLNKSSYLGRVPLSTYAMAMYHGKIYMSGYPGSKLYVYDPARNWTVGTVTPSSRFIHETGALSNPRRLARLKDYSGAEKMYSIVIGANEKIYIGGRWARNGDGGGLAWWDIDQAKAGGTWHEFSNYQIDYMTTVDEDRYVIVSTVAVDDVVLNKQKPRQGKLFVFDTFEGEVIREIEPVYDAIGSGLIAGVGDRFVVGMTDDSDDSNRSIVYKYNILNGKIVNKKRLPYPLAIKLGSNQTEPFDYRLGPDRKIWTFINSVLVQINPDNMEIEVVGKVDLGEKWHLQVATFIL